MRKFVYGVLTLIVIILVATATSIFFQVDSNLSTEQALSSMTPELQIDTQVPGERVVVKSVTLEKPGYVVISDNSTRVTTYPGRSALLTAGVHTNLEIKLDRKVVGETLYAGLYTDNGDGKFSIADDVEATPDPRPIGKNGLPVSTRFAVKTR